MEIPLRVVLVRPEFDINVGSAARSCNNFGITDLVIVNPKAKVGKEAFKYAMHSQELLKKAKKVRTLQEACNSCSLVVGTSGAVYKFRRTLKRSLSLQEFSEKWGGKKTALVFGPEGNGLNEEETAYCDYMLYVPTSKTQPIMNLSHAVAVCLYALCSKYFEKQLTPLPSTPSQKERLSILFKEFLDEVKGVRDKKKVLSAFRHVIARAEVSDEEARALMIAFSKARKN